MSETRLIRRSRGIDTYMTVDGETTTITKKQNIEGHLAVNRALAIANGKRMKSEYANPVASIPAIVQVKWLIEEGWDCLRTHDPDVQKKLKQKLNSNEYRYLRTSEIIF